MTKKWMQFGMLMLLSLFVVTQGLAIETGEIYGKIGDEEGTPLPGVTVRASGVNLQGIRSTISDTNGYFRFPLLPIGEYQLDFELQGFAKLIQQNVIVRLGVTTSLNVVMKIATIEQQLTVIAEAPLIDKSKADNAYNVGVEDLANVPVQGRNIQEIVNLAPGVTGVKFNTRDGVGDEGEASFRGEGASGNNWLVDGISKRGSNHGSGVAVNYDAWDEVQVVSDGFSPELGQAYGGIVNIVTKSGGNEFHGEVGALVLDDGLRATRRPQLAYAFQPQNSYNNFYGNVGGPIVRDKLWFFVSDNFHSSMETGEGLTIDWLTIPSGKQTVNTNNVFAKLTYAFSPNHTLSVNGTLDRFLNQTGGFGLKELYQKSNYTNYAIRANYKGIFGSNTLIEAGFGRSAQKVNWEPLSGDLDSPSFFYNDVQTYTNNVGSMGEDKDNRTDFTTRFTQYINTEKFGNHELGLGFLYYYTYNGTWTTFTGAPYDPFPGNGFDDGIVVTWTEPGIPYRLQELGKSGYFNTTRGIGIHLVDKITWNRFSIMLGVRSETQTPYNDLGERLWTWGLDDFISPRFSLAYDITGDGKNVLKFGFGQFTDTAISDLLVFFNKNGGSRFRLYNWIGPDNPTNSELYDPLNWEFNFQQAGDTTPTLYDPDIKPNKMTKFLLEFDRRLGINWALKLRGIYTNNPNQLEDLAYFTLTDAYYLVQNWDIRRRTYWGLEFELNGKISDKFWLNTSYVYSQAKGTTPGDFEGTGNFQSGYYHNAVGVFGDHFSGPADSPYAWLGPITAGMGGWDYGDEGWYGLLPYSCDHVVKVLGTYFAPYGIIVTGSIEYYNRFHWSIRTLQEAYGAYLNFGYGRGTEDLPAQTYVDLSIQKDFFLHGDNMVLGLRLNVNNLLNSQTPVFYMNAEGTPLYGQVYGRQAPRWTQLQVLFKW
jgi:hypothetical protein